MKTIKDTFTSTGHKFFAHQEAMTKLRNRQGQPIVTHVMLTDICNHTCAFCSVQHRAGDSLDPNAVVSYLDTLKKYGLKAVILSGGGNPILYKKNGITFNNIVSAIHNMGLEIGLITNGMPLKTYNCVVDADANVCEDRKSWLSVWPETLDKLTWIRISMAGLDHKEKEVYVPDINPEKTTLGFSYVAHDIYLEPQDIHHGKVSTKRDLILPDSVRDAVKPYFAFEQRIDVLTDEILSYVETYKPRYVRLLPNCLEPHLISKRCTQLQEMADEINTKVNHEVVFVQYKPPAAPHACYLGYIHPVLNCDGYVYPCDSCVLNDTAGHTFANPWRVCHWSEIDKLYTKPVKSLISDPAKLCPGCVFTKSNEILGSVVDGTADLTPPTTQPEHINFV